MDLGCLISVAVDVQHCGRGCFNIVAEELRMSTSFKSNDKFHITLPLHSIVFALL